MQFFADLWHDGPQAGVKYYYYVVACKNGTTYNWKPSDNKYDDDEDDTKSLKVNPELEKTLITNEYKIVKCSAYLTQLGNSFLKVCID